MRTPTALIEEVVASGATNLEIVCFGGGLGVERLLALGRVKTLYFSFDSMDVLGAAGEFRRAVEAGRVRAVELTTLVMSKALTAAQENLPFLPELGPLESAFIDGDFPLPAFACPVTGRTLHAVPALPLDLALVHAPRADMSGNIELASARGLDRRLIGAAKTRVVSVEDKPVTFGGRSGRTARRCRASSSITWSWRLEVRRRFLPAVLSNRLRQHLRRPSRRGSSGRATNRRPTYCCCGEA